MRAFCSTLLIPFDLPPPFIEEDDNTVKNRDNLQVRNHYFYHLRNGDMRRTVHNKLYKEIDVITHILFCWGRLSSPKLCAPVHLYGALSPPVDFLTEPLGQL